MDVHIKIDNQGQGCVFSNLTVVLLRGPNDPTANPPIPAATQDHKFINDTGSQIEVFLDSPEVQAPNRFPIPPGGSHLITLPARQRPGIGPVGVPYELKRIDQINGDFETRLVPSPGTKPPNRPDVEIDDP